LECPGASGQTFFAVRIVVAEMVRRQVMDRHGVKRDLAPRPEQLRHGRQGDPAARAIGQHINNPHLEDLGGPVSAGGFQINDTQAHRNQIALSGPARTRFRPVNDQGWPCAPPTEAICSVPEGSRK
jgi:hypothetical protein